MSHRGPRTQGDELSYVEADVLALLQGGLSRSGVAAARGVSPAAITHVCHRLERKGWVLPSPDRSVAARCPACGRFAEATP